MFFVASGSLKYYTPLYSETVAVRSDANGCISEAALWGHWVHCGCLTAETHCDLVALQAEKFCSICARNGGVCSDEVHAMLRKYVELFARAMMSFGAETITDIALSVEVLDECVDEAF